MIKNLKLNCIAASNKLFVVFDSCLPVFSVYLLSDITIVKADLYSTCVLNDL